MIDPTRWRHLVADMPIAFIDTETTGADATKDSIAEFAAIMYTPESIETAIAACVPPQDERSVWHLALPQPAYQTAPAIRCNPGMPISSGATRVHGIRDADVAGCPDPHTALAGPLVGLSQGYRIAGYNSASFDLPLIKRVVGVEFAHSLDVMGVVAAARLQPPLDPIDKRPWSAGGPVALLGFESFKNKLGAVYAAIMGRRLEGAHGALADTRASADLLFTLLAVFPGLPADGPALAAAAERALCGVQPASDGTMLFTFGKYEGEAVKDVELANAGYIGWMLDAPDMAQATKDAVVEVIGEARAVQILESRRARPKGGGRRKKTDAAA